ncbi:MAG: polysaccharide pyruvyl transferase family protein [Clostridiales bacterium]|nr:polysaccharide pyruvyl transferase family protein [Clostridiales bacterium]
MKQIILMGASLNSGNRGVNALTRGTINALIDANEDCSITIISYTVKRKIENVIDYHNKILKVNEIPSNLKGGLSFYIKTKFSIDTCFLNRDVYKLLENADIVLDISEGDSFSDIYGYKRFFLHSFLKLGTIKLGKKLILLPQTMGPYNNKFVKLIYCAT